MGETTKTKYESMIPLRIDEQRGDDLRRLIVIPLLQNIIGGVAMALLVGTIGFLFGVDGVLVAQVAGIAGVLLACLATVVRFFADDFGILAFQYNRGYDAAAELWGAEVAELQADLLVAEQKVIDAQRPIYVNQKAHSTIVAASARDAHWQDAQRLLLLAEDNGYLPGRGTTGLSTEAQASAVGVLHRTGCTIVEGKRVK
jgi:hypothetical protein